MKCRHLASRALGVVISLAVSAGLFADDRRAMTVTDMMQFKAIQSATISEDGSWVGYRLRPDRGDGSVRLHDVAGERVVNVPKGSSFRFSKDSRWAAVTIRPTQEELSRIKDKKKQPKPELILIELETLDTEKIDRLRSYAFSDDGRWLVYHRHPEQPKKQDGEEKPEEGASTEGEKAPAEKPEKKKEKKKKKKKKRDDFGPLVARDLVRGSELNLDARGVSYAIDPSSYLIAYVSITDDDEEVLRTHTLRGGLHQIFERRNQRYRHVTWSKEGSSLAFLEGDAEEKNERKVAGTLMIYLHTGGEPYAADTGGALRDGWHVPLKNTIRWSKDGQRIFFGTAPVPSDVDEEDEDENENESEDTEEKEPEPEDPLDIDAALKKRGVDVWHWDDPRIIPNQKRMWPRVRDRTYLAVHHLFGKSVALADEEMPNVTTTENGRFAIGSSQVPYLKEVTWDGNYSDRFFVDLHNGSRHKFLERHSGRISLSPGGGYVAYYDRGHWYLTKAWLGPRGRVRCLTEDLDVPFQNEDHDYPSTPRGYGVVGWTENDRAVLINDKYDIWSFDTGTAFSHNPRRRRITGGIGRERRMVFRNLTLDPEQTALEPNQALLLSGYSDEHKHQGFWECRVDGSGVRRLLGGRHRYSLVRKAKQAERLLITRQSFTEFPDLWVAGRGLEEPQRVSDANPQMAEIAWGRAELFEWSSDDGVPLQGALLKPAGYVEGERVPLIIHFYRLMSDRLYRFSRPTVSHRFNPSFYTSNGYAVLLPDIRFEIGRPGFSATKCLVPAVQKLVEMGIVDPDGVGMQGHSWSGYQAAFMITQTNIFSAAVAGAPVSNMTSAYGGIRWSTGLARQFQYEKTQSRLGASLWENRDPYIQNSPLFFADRVQTPLLIMHGDEDGAVPWYQGIELYLALRRLGKDCIFLQYRGEGHGLGKFPNKLDYTIRMKEYFDHYLKGTPAPQWISDGVPYRGK